MNSKNRWILPEGIDEILPPQAAQVEKLCRHILDLFQVWGYEQCMPPLIEYLDSLLTGTGEDLDIQTFKLTDQLGGRSMGLRADMTPQVARIDAHVLNKEWPTRLSYLGTVVHTLPSGHGGTRAPLQVGAELHGHAGPESDAEILSLMLKTLQLCGVRNAHVDLGHVGIYRGLIARLEISAEQESRLFDALQRKDGAELAEMLENWNVAVDTREMFMSLVELNGDIGVLAEARSALSKADESVARSIDELEKIAGLAKERLKDAPIYFDLAELRGYHYYTGFTFAAYIPGQGSGVAFGGRYDDVGAAFGRARPATGFSTDIKTLFALTNQDVEPLKSAIFAPASSVPGLIDAVEKLREQGEVVIFELPGQTGTAQDLGCNRELILKAGKWILQAI